MAGARGRRRAPSAARRGTGRVLAPRQEIVEAAREGGIDDLAIERGKYLAVLTRERKQHGVETHTWREEIRRRRTARSSGSVTGPARAVGRPT
ncbi:MAG: hypothetical protein ACRDPC_23925, partial [Solirubrobacteraceae bacterium]